MTSPSSKNTYILFLRGINVGGNKKVPMADLKKLLLSLGFRNVKTYLASGNASFEAEKKPTVAEIERQIEKTFGFSVDTVIRTLADLQKIRRSDPFADIDVTKQIRFYVTFLADKPASSLAIPYMSPDKSFWIPATKTEIYSVLDLAIATTPEAMNILEKSYGKKITTRNWNTILKIIDSLV
jgi:uncharacterized protein (DUF1697 family)